MRFLLTILLIFMLCLSAGCASVKNGISSCMIGLEMKRAGVSKNSVALAPHAVPFFEREGDGPVVVLLHGFTSDKKDWIRFAGRLPENYRIIALDLPGHGENTHEVLENYDPQALSRGVGRMIDSLGLRKFHLAGSSLGGLVSKLYARSHPDKVITLGLFNSAGVTPKVPGDFADALEKGENPFNVKNRDDYEVLKTYALYDPPFIPWPLNDVMAQKRISRNPFYMKVFGQLHAHPALMDTDFQTSLLMDLSMPVLVLWGDRDRILNVSSVEVYSRYIQGVETVILKECGHLPMIEQPEESAGYYADFLSRHGL